MQQENGRPTQNQLKIAEELTKTALIRGKTPNSETIILIAQELDNQGYLAQEVAESAKTNLKNKDFKFAFDFFAVEIDNKRAADKAEQERLIEEFNKKENCKFCGNNGYVIAQEYGQSGKVIGDIATPCVCQKGDKKATKNSIYGARRWNGVSAIQPRGATHLDFSAVLENAKKAMTRAA